MRIRELGLVPSLPLHDNRSVAVQRIRRTGDTELKVITIAAGAATELHRHAHQHDLLVLAGRGRVSGSSRERPIGPDDVVVVAPWEPHVFETYRDAELRFVCLDSPGNRSATPERQQNQDSIAGEANR